MPVWKEISNNVVVVFWKYVCGGVKYGPVT